MKEAFEKPVPKTLVLGVCPGVEGLNIYPFDAVFKERKFLSGPDDVKNVDAVILWGGTDIGAGYYGEKPSAMNQQQNPMGSTRDSFEWSIIKAAHGLNKPIIGVCRGAQFLCAAAGGKLVQHMDKPHRGTHQIWVSGVKMHAACDHHQRLVITNVKDSALLAWHDDGTPEVVYFPHLRALAIQPHPEWMGASSPFVEWCVDKVEQLMANNITQEIVV